MSRDKSTEVLKLANKIVEGRVSYLQTERKIMQIESKYGDLVVPYDISEKSDKEYMEELNEIIHMGIYSKPVLLKMAAIAEEIYSRKLFLRKILYIMGVIFFVLLLMLLLFIIF